MIISFVFGLMRLQWWTAVAVWAVWTPVDLLFLGPSRREYLDRAGVPADPPGTIMIGVLISLASILIVYGIGRGLRWAYETLIRRT